MVLFSQFSTSTSYCLLYILQPSALENGPYDYTRSGNPTRTALERCLFLLIHILLSVEVICQYWNADTFFTHLATCSF